MLDRRNLDCCISGNFLGNSRDPLVAQILHDEWISGGHAA